MLLSSSVQSSHSFPHPYNQTILFVLAFTAWACISPRTTLLTATGIPLVILLLFIYICHNTPAERIQKISSSSPKRKRKNSQSSYNWKDKLQTAKRSLLLVLSLVVGVTCEYLTVQAVVTTIAFPNAPFPPSVHYELYFFSFAMGELFGRSYSIIVSYLCSSWCTNMFTEKTWIFTGIMAANLIFTIFASWFRFLPQIWPVFLILFEHGITAGFLYLNTFAMAGIHEKDARGREFSRAFVSIGCGLGLTLAGFVGLVIEPLLKEHCLEISTSLNQPYCFTRAVGVNATLQCI